MVPIITMRKLCKCFQTPTIYKTKAWLPSGINVWRQALPLLKGWPVLVNSEWRPVLMNSKWRVLFSTNLCYPLYHYISHRYVAFSVSTNQFYNMVAERDLMYGPLSYNASTLPLSPFAVLNIILFQNKIQYIWLLILNNLVSLTIETKWGK